MTTYQGKPVYDQDTFSYEIIQIGDFVIEAVVDDAMDLLPPACMTSTCSQMGEPYSHREDPDTGRWRPTFATFRRVSHDHGGIWEYCGHCFRGETIERGLDPSIVIVGKSDAGKENL